MLVVSNWIEDTAKRWAERRTQRMRSAQPIRAGNLLLADSPARLEMRMMRLAQSPGRLERFIGGSDLLDINYLRRGYQASRSVARVHVRNRAGQTVGYGTGFLIAPSLLLTNAHVLADPTEAVPSLVEFDYEAGPDGALQAPLTLRLDPGTFWRVSPFAELDAAIVAVADPDGRLANYGWHPLVQEEGKVVLGEPLTIVQHPSGQPKQIALRQNLLLDLLDRHLHYQTDTAPGSSGAPVFNNQWEVVALHHMGVPKTDAAGNYLKKDGSLWANGEDDALVDWIANEGIRTSRLARWLRGLDDLTAAQRALLEPVFIRPADVPMPESAFSGHMFTLGDARGGSSIVVPLHVTVHLGGGGAQPARIASAPAPAAPAPRPARPASNPDADPAVRAALADLEEAKKKPYYGEQKDKQDSATYYQGLAAGGTRKQRFDALHQLLTTTHTTQPKYKPLTWVYPWVDLHPDKRIRSIYSGRTFEPSELIRADFEIDRRRAELSEVLLLEAAREGRTAQEALALLEAQLPYNCEHVVPQSWFDKREPMRGDIHHLFACESGCNSFRSNTPYFDFTDFEEVVRTECGKREGDKFEPSSGKGVVARAVLYFLLRYPGEVNNLAREYSPARIQTIIAWHKGDTPGRYEQHRNAAVFAIQGNRNPLIDFPDDGWVDGVDFLAGLG